MKIIFLNIYYDDFMKSHYDKNPLLASKSYTEQFTSLIDTNFGDSDFYDEGFRKSGWDAETVIINCPPLQEAWARENDFSGNPSNAWIEQIKRAKPEVVYTQGLWLHSTEKEIRPYIRLFVGQVASPTSYDVQAMDLVITSMPHFVDRFRDAGVNAQYVPLAIHPRVVQNGLEREFPLVFVGSLTSMHKERIVFIKELSKHFHIDYWGIGQYEIKGNNNIKYHGEIWGNNMFNILCRSRVALNQHIDVAEEYANNMRLYEVTGCGALLVTDNKRNLGDLFEVGREIVAYDSVDGCARAIDYYLNNREEGKAIALAGQKRTLSEYTYDERMAEVAKLMEDLL